MADGAVQLRAKVAAPHNPAYTPTMVLFLLLCRFRSRTDIAINQYHMAEENDKWLTVPTTDDEGNTIIVTGLTDVEKFRSKPRYSIRINITLPYSPVGPLGFPDEETAATLEEVTEAFQANLKGKNTAVLTGIYTGAGQRDWVFYTFSTDVFNGFLNRALAQLPLLPLEISAENDPDWEEYDEMMAVFS